MTIRLVSAGDGTGLAADGPPIHVRLVEDTGAGSGGVRCIAAVAGRRRCWHAPAEAATPKEAKESVANVVEPEQKLVAPSTPPVEAPDLLPVTVETREARKDCQRRSGSVCRKSRLRMLPNQNQTPLRIRRTPVQSPRPC